MKPGDIIYTSSIRTLEPGISFDYSAGKKKVFVFLCLGIQPMDWSENLDPIKRLKDLGWEKRGSEND